MCYSSYFRPLHRYVKEVSSKFYNNVFYAQFIHWWDVQLFVYAFTCRNASDILDDPTT